MTMNKTLRAALALAIAAAILPSALAQEAVIRSTLAKRLPDLPHIDEVSKTPIPGLYEVRMGSEILYTDERGEYVVQGSIVDTKTRSNLTEARLDKLTAIDFDKLPLQDAIVWKQGSGARKLVVFADPNCGYCKKLESDLQQVKDVTVYTFLYPILGGDSPTKARDIWCASDHGTVWRNWMIRGTAAPRSIGRCDTSVLARNLELGKHFRVTATPNLVFEDGKRIPGALAADEVEKQLLASRSKG